MIKIERNGSIFYGDFYIKCEVRFNPIIPPETSKDKITLMEVSAKLEELGYRIAAEMTAKLKKELNEAQIET